DVWPPPNKYWTRLPPPRIPPYGTPCNLIRQPCKVSGQQPLRRTPHPEPAPIEHVGVDHRGRYIPMPQQLLHRANVIPRLKQVRREGMPQRMTARPFPDSARPNRLGHPPLHRTLVQMVPP